MRNTTAIMVDLETLSTEPNAAILSIGAVAFDPAQLMLDTEQFTDRFYRTISIESNMAHGLDISAGTLKWWMSQNPDALRALFEDNPGPLNKACTEFFQWVDQQKPRIASLWANDPDFDVVILRSAFQAAKVLWPYHFSINRSCRTVREWAWPEGDAPNFRAGTLHHRADDDAAAQALMVQAAFHKLVLNG